MKKINISDLNNNVFELISKDWGVVTVQSNNKVNGMTASWIQMGHLWNKNIVTVYVRPQRYTYSFMNDKDTFSVAFFDEKYRKELGYLGTKSGREFDKISECGMTTSLVDDTPIINEAKLVFVCKKLYVHDLKDEEFVSDEVKNESYPAKDFHRVFIGEITSVLVKD
ncbi:flavin reductase family protein [Anaerorhabdus sp.]|uniref:flavin reductase family protein n=1 Tax=Anaerorhabdus sp. TaxID=1872524 RepID=UPI002FC76F16